MGTSVVLRIPSASAHEGGSARGVIGTQETPLSTFPSHLQALLQPEAYQHPAARVELIETHVSWVLLTGEFAYKIKRPVHYGFIDLRSPEHRAFLCREEIRLNRRFAPDLYLDVQPISLHEGIANLTGRGRVIEQAVRMRQYSRTHELDHLLEANHIEPAELKAFGRDLARIHARLPRAPSKRRRDWSDALRARVLANAAACLDAADSVGSTRSMAGLESALSAAWDSAVPLLARRLATGRVRECHGDLHARNIVRLAGRLCAFDCLEFDPALRWIDVADEIAFLLADLDTRERPAHAQAFLAGYLAESGDYQACALLPLFKAHRALVRAKVATLAAGSEDARTAAHEFDAYVADAQRALLAQIPVLVLMCGLSGSGKSYLAGRLAPGLAAVWLRSDVERKRLAGRGALTESRSGIGGGLYSLAATAGVYRHLLQCASDTLAGGCTTIIDATLARRVDRIEFSRLAARLGVPSCIVHCRAPREVLEARIRERQWHSDDPSEADRSVLTWQEARFETPQPGEAGALLEASSADTGAPDRLLQAIGALRAGARRRAPARRNFTALQLRSGADSPPR